MKRGELFWQQLRKMTAAAFLPGQQWWKNEVQHWREKQNQPGWRFIFTESRQWHYLEALLTLTLLLILLLAALRPTVLAISQVIGEIKARRQIASQMQANINRLVAAQQDYFQLSQQLYLLDEYYPRQPAITVGLAQLVGLALDKGLRVKNVSFDQFQAPNISRQPGQLGFSLTVGGNFAAISNFLAEIKTLRRALLVKEVDLRLTKKEEMSPAEMANPELECNLRGSLAFYSLKKLKTVRQR